jgi:CTP synthase (UTP-ammonia lyase)
MRLIDADTVIVEIGGGYIDIDSESFMSAPTIKTKQIKYFDEDESVWKVGSVIVDE